MRCAHTAALYSNVAQRAKPLQASLRELGWVAQQIGKRWAKVLPHPARKSRELSAHENMQQTCLASMLEHPCEGKIKLRERTAV